MEGIFKNQNKKKRLKPKLKKKGKKSFDKETRNGSSIPWE